MTVFETREQSREADERRGFGCAGSARSSWFDEAVDFGWWCGARGEFIGDPIKCAEFAAKGASAGASGGREPCGRSRLN